MGLVVLIKPGFLLLLSALGSFCVDSDRKALNEYQEESVSFVPNDAEIERAAEKRSFLFYPHETSLVYNTPTNYHVFTSKLTSPPARPKPVWRGPSRLRHFYLKVNRGQQQSSNLASDHFQPVDNPELDLTAGQDENGDFKEKRRYRFSTIDKQSPVLDKRGFSFIQPVPAAKSQLIEYPNDFPFDTRLIKMKKGFPVIQRHFKRGFSFIQPQYQDGHPNSKRGFSFIQPGFLSQDGHFDSKRGFSFIQPGFEDQDGLTITKRGFSFIQPRFQNQDGQPNTKRGFSFIQPKFQNQDGQSNNKRGFSFIQPGFKNQDGHPSSKRGFSFIQPGFQNQDGDSYTKRGFSFIQPRFQNQDENSDFKRGFSFIQPGFQNLDTNTHSKRGFSFIQPGFQNQDGHPNSKRGFSFIQPGFQNQDGQANSKRGFSFIQPGFENQDGDSYTKRGFSFIQPGFQNQDGQFKSKRGFSFIQPSFGNDDSKRGFYYGPPGYFARNAGLSDRYKRGFSFIQPNFEEKRLLLSRDKDAHSPREPAAASAARGKRDSPRGEKDKIDLVDQYLRQLAATADPDDEENMSNKRSALIKSRYGTGSSAPRKVQRLEDEIVRVEDKVVRPWWDPKEYIIHPYQFNKHMTPLRLLTVGNNMIVCDREDLQDYAELDELLSSRLRSDLEPEELFPEPEYFQPEQDPEEEETHQIQGVTDNPAVAPVTEKTLRFPVNEKPKNILNIYKKLSAMERDLESKLDEDTPLAVPRRLVLQDNTGS